MKSAHEAKFFGLHPSLRDLGFLELLHPAALFARAPALPSCVTRIRVNTAMHCRFSVRVWRRVVVRFHNPSHPEVVERECQYLLGLLG